MRKVERLINEKGIALVTVLILTAIMLVMIAGLLYMVTVGTQVSGIAKRYKTALEAGIGGTEVIFELISQRNKPPINLSEFYAFEDGKAGKPVCLSEKLNKSTSNWNQQFCSSTLTIDPNDPTTYDMRFDLGLSPVYRVYAKIVDTVEGNSGGDEGLIKGGVVESNPGEVSVMSIPYLYTIEILAQEKDNPSERARLSILYEY
jgi:hypothetical protein